LPKGKPLLASTLLQAEVDRERNTNGRRQCTVFGESARTNVPETRAFSMTYGRIFVKEKKKKEKKKEAQKMLRNRHHHVFNMLCVMLLLVFFGMHPPFRPWGRC
jgi:hypothetical protein